MVIGTNKNRTTRYLRNTLNGYGKTFLQEMTQLSSYAGYPLGSTLSNMYIMDNLYYRAKSFKEVKPYLFLCFDTRGCYNEKQDKYTNVKIGKDKLIDFVKYIRKSKYYIDDYWFGKNQHCIVLECCYPEAYSKFWTSEYSKMYSVAELKKLGFTKTLTIGGKNYSNLTYAVLTKDSSAKLNLEHEVYKYYNVSETAEDPDEYDIPWFLADEVCNYLSMTDEENLRTKSWKFTAKSLLI